MHPNTARVLQIMNHIEWLMSPEHFLTDPACVAIATENRERAYVPLHALGRFGPLIKMQVTVEEMLDACTHSRCLRLVPNASVDAMVELPFRVNPRVLLVNHISGIDMSGLIDFVRTISGDHQFLFYPVSGPDGPEQWTLAFPTAELAIAFWRAVPYCRFMGRTLEISAFSPEIRKLTATRPAIVVETPAQRHRRVVQEHYTSSDLRRRWAELLSGALKKGMSDG